MSEHKVLPATSDTALPSTKTREERNETIERGSVSGLEIEGGSIPYFEWNPSNVEFHEAEHRAHTARRLAYWLVIILGVSIVAHYLSTMVLELNGKHEAAESLAKIFNSWLPVLSGLVGGASTYYFTRDKH
jgi:hypothetical protein